MENCLKPFTALFLLLFFQTLEKLMSIKDRYGEHFEYDKFRSHTFCLKISLFLDYTA